MEEKSDIMKKDFFDKLSSLSGVFIAIAGFMATFIYNGNQVKIQEQKTNSEIKATEVELLEKCMKYVTSENPKEREFGYAVFSNMGYQELAVNLIDIKQDAAGINVVRSIAQSSDKKISNYASGILAKLSNDPKQKIKQIVNYFETGDINKFPGDSIELDKNYFNRADSLAKQLGIKSTLGLLVLYDSYVHSGGGSLAKHIAKVNAKLHGAPKDGISEGLWLKSYLEYRIEWLKTVQHLPPQIAKRPRFLLEQVEKGNYNLNSIEGE